MDSAGCAAQVDESRGRYDSSEDRIPVYMNGISMQSTFQLIAHGVIEIATRHDYGPPARRRLWGWTVDRHQGDCRHLRPCACCIARVVDIDGSCEMCIMAWRLSCLNKFMRDRVVAHGFAQPRRYDQVQELIKNGLRQPLGNGNADVLFSRGEDKVKYIQLDEGYDVGVRCDIMPWAMNVAHRMEEHNARLLTARFIQDAWNGTTSASRR